MSEEMMRRIRARIERDMASLMMTNQRVDPASLDRRNALTSQKLYHMLDIFESAPPAPPQLRFIIQDAQQQRRTIRDVKLYRVRPKCPSKAKGRRGTRRNWKRRNPPHWVYGYREPDNVIQFNGLTIVTPRQYRAIMAATLAGPETPTS